MAERVRSKDVAPPPVKGNYFSDEKEDIEFVTSGCHILDCTLAGGWPLGRVSNTVGDKSTGKSLLAIEQCANFAARFPKGRIHYREVESAFDKGYAEALGMPTERVQFEPFTKGKDKIDTVEELFEDLKQATQLGIDKKVPSLYIVDSFDALTTEIDNDREFGEQTYRTDKPTMMGELFRKQVRPLDASRTHFSVISQVRDKIGVMFGKKYSRSGGRALDFYASQVLYLSHIQTLVRTVGKTKRATAVRIKAKCEKNKIGLPFRECEFVLRFGYGIDDLAASVEWLDQVNRLKDITRLKPSDFLDAIEDLGDKEYRAETRRIGQVASEVWRGIDRSIMPLRKKYYKEE